MHAQDVAEAGYARSPVGQHLGDAVAKQGGLPEQEVADMGDLQR